MYFSYFLNYAPPKPSEMENYGMVLAFFGNHISKCNRLSKNIRPIQAIEVLHRLRNKQKHYLIYSETPCRIVTDIFCHNDNNCHGLKQINSTKIDLDNITRIVTDIFCHNDNNCH